MSWNLEGKYVEGVYLGNIFIQGTVTNSRVKYGGKVQHTVSLDIPVTIFGSERDHLLIDEENITAVFDNEEAFS